MAVKEWGKGRPDYYKPTLPARPSIVRESDTQIGWRHSADYNVATWTTDSYNIYTVPAGYSLSLGILDISCDNSCINAFRLLADATEIMEFKFDFNYALDMSSITGQDINEGQSIYVYITNNNVLNDKFYLTISGVLTKILGG